MSSARIINRRCLTANYRSRGTTDGTARAEPNSFELCRVVTEENGVKVGTNDPILMHYLLSFDWQIVFSLLTKVAKSSKWLKTNF